MIDESVSGSIIGAQYSVAAIYYDGRKQCGNVYGETIEEVKGNCAAKIAMIKADCGEVFSLIYPKDAWEIKILQG